MKKSKQLFIVTFMLLALLQNALSSEKKAYILIGDVSGYFQSYGAYSAALEAKKDLEAAGYTVVLKEGATIQDVKDALNDQNIRALWITGHGHYADIIGPNCKKTWGPIPGIKMKDESTVLTPQGINNLPGWRNLFPNVVNAGKFRAWSNKLRWWQLYFYQRFKTYDPPSKYHIFAKQ